MQPDDIHRGRSGSPPTIDMTLDGRVIDPPGRWTRWLALWHALPRGSVPAFVFALTVVLIGAVLLLGFLVVVVPVALVLGLLAMLLRGPGRGPGTGGVARR